MHGSKSEVHGLRFPYFNTVLFFSVKKILNSCHTSLSVFRLQKFFIVFLFSGFRAEGGGAEKRISALTPPPHLILEKGETKLKLVIFGL